jgi:hypothetical protein
MAGPVCEEILRRHSREQRLGLMSSCQACRDDSSTTTNDYTSVTWLCTFVRHVCDSESVHAQGDYPLSI